MEFVPHVIDGICREEVFGPVVTIAAFDDDEDAIRSANDTRYGLNAMVFTRDLSRALAQGRGHSGLSGAGSCALVLPGQYEDGDLPDDLGLVLAERGMPRDQHGPQLVAGGVVKLLRHCGERLGTHLDRDAGVGLEIVVPGRVLG
jgi:hypothetical protein